MYLKKTMLAVAITMATSGYALAETVVLNNSPISLNSVYTEELTLTGVQYGNLDPATIDHVQVHGNFTNKARITATGQGSIGLMLYQSEIGNPEASAETFQGDIVNENIVWATGVDSFGMTVEDTKAGSLINGITGQIIASGANSTGLHLSGANLRGVVLNEGLIHGASVGLDVDSNALATQHTTLRGIDNSGTIQATAGDGRAILIDGATFYESARGLVNTGYIRGGEIGVDFDQFTMEVDPTNHDPEADYDKTHFQVLAEAGEISGGEYAIKGGAQRVDLTLGNTDGRGISTIRGNLDGIALTKVVGPADFTGTNIQSQEVRINSGASLTLNNAHTTIDGDLNVLSGGALGLPLSAETLHNTPVLNVTGAANLASGSSVVINAKGSDFAKGGAYYDLIAANSLTVASDAQITSSSALLAVKTMTTENGKLNVQVTTIGDEETGDVVGDGGGNSNVQETAKAYMEVASLIGTTNPNDPVLKALIAAGDDKQAIANIAKQLSPEVNGGAASAANSSLTLVSNAISTRSSDLRAGESSGDALDGAGVWFQVLNSNASQDMRSGIDGYDADSNGFAVGADKKLNESTTVGVAYSFVKTDVTSDNSGNKTDVDNHTLTAYGSWTQGNYFVDGGLSYGKGKNESKRYITGATAKADYDSDMIGLNVMGGYGFHFDHGILVEPRVAARYTNLSIDSLSETSSTPDLSARLSTGSQRVEVGELGAGVRVASSFDLARGTLEPEIKLMAYHDFIGDKTKTTSAFVQSGNAFVTTGASPARDSYEVGVGANYKLGAVTVGASYDRLMKTGFDADAFTAKVRYDF